ACRPHLPATRYHKDRPILSRLPVTGQGNRTLYSSNTNISFFHSADEFEIVRQQRTQFALVFA
ncbi:MAG: hypothetical protein, partial [Olavius algarvensis Gamma 1 endosymbiont]